MTVFLISIDSVPSAHLVVKNNLTSAQKFLYKTWPKFSRFLKCQFLSFIIIVHHNKFSFLNPFTNLNKTGIHNNKKYCVGDLHAFDLIST